MKSRSDAPRHAFHPLLRLAVLVGAAAAGASNAGCYLMSRCNGALVLVDPIPLSAEQRDELAAYCSARCPGDAERELFACGVRVPRDGEATLECSFVARKDPDVALTLERSRVTEPMVPLSSGMGGTAHCAAACPEAPEAKGEAQGCRIEADGIACVRVTRVCMGG